MIAMNTMLVYPMFALFLLTGVVLVKMFRTRVAAVKSGKLKVGAFKVYDMPMPEDVLKVSRHFTNLFEAPVLFYVVCLLGMILNVQAIHFLIFAWVYVIARVVHAIIHIGSNKLKYRMPIYGLSWICLVVMWLTIVIRVLLTAQV
ncbi:MAG: MAPEG family protein [Bdellovibrio sp.]|nr:MAPEG family protein [Bdellovibrio sp.]